MNGLRNTVFDLLAADSGLNAAQISLGNLYPSAPDTPGDRIWAVTKWMEAGAGMGPVNTAILQLWVYDRDGGYGRIGSALLAGRAALNSLPSTELNDSTGWVSAVEWQGSSPDLWDDIYAAATRWESYRIVSSGV